MEEKIVFEPLTSHPEYVDELRQRYWKEWSESLKREFHIQDFSEYKLSSNITYYVAIEYLSKNENENINEKEKKLVGSIGLTPSDMEELTHLTPWMSYVYILPEYRNKGIAHKMINWFLNTVKTRPIYLWCKHPLEKFYKDFGYEIIENRDDISVMRNVEHPL